MELEINGLTVEVKPAELDNDQLTGLAQEVLTAANERGLELPFATGAVAVEGAMQADEVAETSHDPDVKETIKSLLTPAYGGYQAIVESVNGSRMDKEQLTVAEQKTAETEFEEWFDEDRLAYVKKTMEANPNLIWTLLATPNVTVTADEFLAGTKTFGEGQPYPTEIRSDIAKGYSPEEISGTDPSNGKAFKFKLVPNRFTREIHGEVPIQKAKLAGLQTEYPFLDSTSPLEDLTWLNTKRASGQKLVGSSAYDATYMHSFGLEPQRLGRDLFVPGLYVFDLGGLVVVRSWIGFSEVGRVSVG